MNAIVFHGVPQGHDVYGNAGDKYYESFYGIGESFKGAKRVFVVEIRKDTTGLCSYYSYIRPQNVVAHSGRPGSYFGMSLKVEGRYCTDVFSLFQLFDKIYYEKIIGTIIQQSGNTEQYCIASFADVDYQLKAIAQLGEGQIKANFENDFEVIDSSFTKKYASTSLYYNLDDVNSESFFNCTKVYGKIFVSPEYASKDALILSLSNSEKKNQNVIADNEIKISELKRENAQIPSLNNQITKLQSDYGNLAKQYQSLQNTANNLKNENIVLDQHLKKVTQDLERIKKSSNISQVANRLEPALNELLGIMRSVKPSFETRTSTPTELKNDGDSSPQGGTDKYTRFLLYFLMGLILFLLSILWLGGKNYSTIKKEKATIDKKYDELKKEYAHYKDETSAKDAQKEEFFCILSKDEKYKNASFEVKDESKNLITGCLQCGKKYYIECTGVDQEGMWKSDGFSILSNKKKNPVEVQVDNVDKAVLSFLVKNKEVVKIEYQVKEKK